MMIRNIFKNAFDNSHLSKVVLLNKIDSTNNYIKENDYLPDDTLVIANSQYAGKGCNGRSFYSPKGGVYFSLKIAVPEELIGIITCVAAIAVHDAVYTLYGVENGIKWINDIYIDSYKLCGILCEKVNDSVIIGIGINVKKQKFDCIDNDAAYLEKYTKCKVKKSVLINNIVNNLYDLCENYSKREIINKYKKYLCVWGKKIKVVTFSETFTAIATDINDECNLIVQKDDGAETVLMSGGGRISFI